jgi:hypothetical protein
MSSARNDMAGHAAGAGGQTEGTHDFLARGVATAEAAETLR